MKTLASRKGGAEKCLSWREDKKEDQGVGKK
jgi:hypothetical protein